MAVDNESFERCRRRVRVEFSGRVDDGADDKEDVGSVHYHQSERFD